jgi:hypothetical protein
MMPRSPLVTIVVTAYCSRAEHLRAALASAVAQTCGQFELIVSDDSPTDTLHSVVMEFQDTRLSYRCNKSPLGTAVNHWTCFREAKGEFIVILNHDDMLEPDFLECLLPPLMRDQSLALAFCDHWIMDDAGTLLRELSDDNSRIYRRVSLPEGSHHPFHQLLLHQTIPMAMGSVFRRSALPPMLPDDAGPAYDLWLTYLLARTGAGAWFVQRRLSRWRSHDANQTAQASMTMLEAAAKCWATIAADNVMSDISGAARRRASGAFISCSRGAWRRGRRKDAQRHAMRSIGYAPTVRGLACLALAHLPRF